MTVEQANPTNTQPDAEQAPTPAGASLTARTASGFVWLAARTVATKGLAFVTQIVLAYLLVPADFGLVGLAYTFAAFANLISQAGLRQVLIQQHDQFATHQRAALWLSVVAGVSGALLIAALTPVAAALYDEPRLVAVMLTLALAPPVEALGIVPRAKMESAMRFRFLAGMEVSVAVLQAAITITLASMGFGALAVVAPRPIVSTLRTVTMWMASGVGFPGGPTTRGWRTLLSGSLAIIGATFAYTATMQGDYLLLGVFYDTAVVGMYYFAFNLSMQSVALFTTNMQAVLLPALSNIKFDQRRQAQAMTRSAAALSAIASPIVLWLACAGGPLIRTIFDPKWADAGVIFSILNLAVIGRMLGAPASDLVQAQGRYRAYFLMHLTSALVFFPVVGFSVWVGRAEGAAVGVLVHAWIYALMMHLVAMRPTALCFRRHVWNVVGPVAAALVAFAPFYGISRLIGWQSPQADVVKTLLMLALGGLSYLAIVRVWSKSTVNELIEQIASHLPARFANRLLVCRPRLHPHAQIAE